MSANNDYDFRKRSIDGGIDITLWGNTTTTRAENEDLTKFMRDYGLNTTHGISVKNPNPPDNDQLSDLGIYIQSFVLRFHQDPNIRDVTVYITDEDIMTPQLKAQITQSRRYRYMLYIASYNDLPLLRERLHDKNIFVIPQDVDKMFTTIVKNYKKYPGEKKPSETRTITLINFSDYSGEHNIIMLDLLLDGRIDQATSIIKKYYTKYANGRMEYVMMTKYGNDAIYDDVKIWEILEKYGEDGIPLLGFRFSPGALQSPNDFF